MSNDFRKLMDKIALLSEAPQIGGKLASKTLEDLQNANYKLRAELEDAFEAAGFTRNSPRPEEKSVSGNYVIRSQYIMKHPVTKKEKQEQNVLGRKSMQTVEVEYQYRTDVTLKVSYNQALNSIESTIDVMNLEFYETLDDTDKKSKAVYKKATKVIEKLKYSKTANSNKDWQASYKKYIPSEK